MNGYPRSCSMPHSSTKSQNLRPEGLNLDEIPVLNSMPSLSSSSDAHCKSSKSTFCSSVSLKEKIKKREKKPVRSSLVHPLFNSKSGRKFARCLGAEPVCTNEQGVCGCFTNSNTRSRDFYKEVIVISDAEEEANRSHAKTLDLTLRL